jgi:hypothetical protein
MNPFRGCGRNNQTISATEVHLVFGHQDRLVAMGDLRAWSRFVE